MKALRDGTYKLIGEMLSTMTIQGGLLPQVFDSTAVNYLLKCAINIEADMQDLPKSKLEALTKVRPVQ